MKIIHWNCNMAFRKKNEPILALQPDIVIICECENPEKLMFGTLTPIPFDYYWHGTNQHKGVGIFSYSNYKLELIEDFNPNLRFVIPLKVSSEKDTFFLFAVWAMDNKEKVNERYIAQVWLAINHYAAILDSDVILIGDFNSNAIWDKEKRIASHTDVVKKLSEKNIMSLYHNYFKEEQGIERQPTFFLHRNITKGYHLDYCFASEKFWSSEYKINIGTVEDWIALSDHLPIEIEFS